MFVCECGKEFQNNQGLAIHKARWCSLLEVKTFHCHCGEVFGRLRGKNSLRSHSKTCMVFQEFRSKQRSEAARSGFKKSIERDPERIKRIRKDAGQKVSKTIMSDPEERKRRANLIGTLNKTDQFRRKASETAKKTSARPDIQEKRALVLKRWREENPEAFKRTTDNVRKVMREWIKNNPEEHYNKCVKPLLSNWKSKPEMCLLEFCRGIVSDCRNYFLIEKIFTTKTNKRQIDIYSESKHIIVEFDGPLHFKPIFGADDFEGKKRKDREINSLCDRYCIIRVSYDCYSYSTHNFTDDTLNAIRELLLNPKNGLYLFGSKYGKD